MNKAELVEAMASKTGLTQKDARAALEAALDGVTAELSRGGEVALTGFGTFVTSNRAARMGRNPRTGAAIQVPATRVPKFRAGKNLKGAVK